MGTAKNKEIARKPRHRFMGGKLLIPNTRFALGTASGERRDRGRIIALDALYVNRVWSEKPSKSRHLEERTKALDDWGRLKAGLEFGCRA
jgi:hypothetical protein